MVYKLWKKIFFSDKYEPDLFDFFFLIPSAYFDFFFHVFDFAVSRFWHFANFFLKYFSIKTQSKLKVKIMQSLMGFFLHREKTLGVARFERSISDVCFGFYWCRAIDILWKILFLTAS